MNKFLHLKGKNRNLVMYKKYIFHDLVVSNVTCSGNTNLHVEVCALIAKQQTFLALFLAIFSAIKLVDNQCILLEICKCDCFLHSFLFAHRYTNHKPVALSKEIIP